MISRGTLEFCVPKTLRRPVPELYKGPFDIRSDGPTRADQGSIDDTSHPTADCGMARRFQR